MILSIIHTLTPRVVKGWLDRDKPSEEELAQAEAYEAIRQELVSLRKELFILEKIAGSFSDERLDDISLQIQAKKEREHILIKQAKRIRGEQINIQSSLLEHNAKVNASPSTH